MSAYYNFVTKWEFNAALQDVWGIITNSIKWPVWWKGVLAVKEVESGDEIGINGVREYVWKSFLPYKLKFSMKLIERIEYQKLSAIAFGELEGTGTWIFEHKDGITYVTYLWDVKTNKLWMNYFAFILKPIFKYNHNIAMKWGFLGIKKQLKENNL
jgi:hypothetical protein